MDVKWMWDLYKNINGIIKEHRQKGFRKGTDWETAIATVAFHDMSAYMIFMCSNNFCMGIIITKVILLKNSKSKKKNVCNNQNMYTNFKKIVR